MIKKNLFLALLSFAVWGYTLAQSPCNLSTYSSATVIPATGYPYFSAGSGITVSATAVGVSTLSNTSYTCGGQTFATASPAWWLNSSSQSITFNFSAAVESFTIVFNGTNQCEEFYFASNSACPLSVSNFCNNGYVAINGGSGIAYNNSPASGNIVTISVPGGATQYTITHNGCGAGSRIALLDCIQPASGGGGGGSSVINPVANITVCNGATVPASAYSTTPAGGTFTWTNSITSIGLAASGSGNTPSFSAINNTSSPVSSTITVSSPASGCSAAPTPISYTITVNPTPTANPIADVSYCNTANVPATTFSSTPTGANFNWTNSNTSIGLIASGSGNLPTFTATNPGSTPITATISYTPTLNSCIGTASTFNITVNPSADANWTTPSSLCSSSPPINLDLQITGTTGGTWSGTGVSGNTFDPSFGNQSVTYTVGSGACQQTLTQTITVISAVDPNWTNPSPLCASSGTFNLNPQITGTTGGTWSGTGVTGNTFNLSSGTQAITYTIGSGVCQQTLTQTITVNPDVDSSWTNPSPLCASSVTFNLNPQITGTTGGTWSGTGVTGNIFNLSSGTHAITYTVGAVACQESYTQTITVLPDVNPNWTSPTGICQDETSFDLTTTITGTTGGTWSGTGITGNMFDPNVGTQSITYTVGTAPCLESETHQIIISPIPTVSVQAQSLNLCEGESINLFATSPNAGNNAQYSWTGPNGASSSLQNPSFNNADTTNTGYYSAQVTSSVGCISEPDSVLVTIFPKPQISFTGINLEGCPTLCPTIISTSTSGSTSAITNYVWTLSNGNTYSGQSFTDCFENNGSSDMSLSVTLQATTNHNCNNQATTINFINVYHHPTAAFQYNPTTLDVMHSQVNFTNLSSNATSYYWHFEGQNSSVETNPTVIFPEIAQSYEVFLVASTDKGCVDTARTTITINDLVIFYIPNTFTPDGDEFNQMFKPIITSGIDPYSYALSIYDRWGELIFESHDIQIGWDGTYQGKICKEGAYIWKISFKETSSDKKQVHQGHLNLLK